MRIPCIEKPRPKSIYTRYARRTQADRCAWQRQRCSLLQGLFGGLGLRVGLGLTGLPSPPWLSVLSPGLVSGLPSPGGDKGLKGGPPLLPPGLVFGFGLPPGGDKGLKGGPPSLPPGLVFGLGGGGKGLGGGRSGRVSAGLSFLFLIKVL